MKEIRVVNAKNYKPRDGEVMVWIDRRSPVGNPFVMHSEANRDLVCDKYNAYFIKQVTEKTDVAFMNYLRRIWKASQTRDIALICHCAPKQCHGDTIKRFIESF